MQHIVYFETIPKFQLFSAFDTVYSMFASIYLQNFLIFFLKNSSKTITQKGQLACLVG